MIALRSFPRTPSAEPKLVWGVLFSSLLHLVLVFVLVGVPGFSSPKRTYFSSVYKVKLVDMPVSTRRGIGVSKTGGKQGGKASGIKTSTKQSKKAKSKKGITLSKKSSTKKGSVAKGVTKKTKKRNAEKAFSLAMSRIKGKVEEKRRKEEIARIQEKIVEEGEREGEGEGEGGNGVAALSGGIPPGGVVANLPLNYRLYYQAIEQKIKSNWNLALPRGVIEDMRGMEVVLSITIRSDGEIIETSFEEKSGNVYLDDSAFRAVKKSNPLPPFSEYNIRESSFETGIIFPAGELL